ncbi:hypothetical protein M527_25710 [Sphingobium indicum IP26]|uniref:Uncharacterized protein n=1 Tax=Sphingobium indicum F2 TaxID=1450518 RepID=A0A8E0WPM0_9SPHN|nr:hypothetical protein M527_25710 [Sphingobium indicum IP26]EQB03052.1 hypothetical protein L286_13610 [Sphingobium sp. HDIP04]KER34954.1 hypothetical protein AL00_18805 [Sphingobium indicum F2]
MDGAVPQGGGRLIGAGDRLDRRRGVSSAPAPAHGWNWPRERRSIMLARRLNLAKHAPMLTLREPEMLLAAAAEGRDCRRSDMTTRCARLAALRGWRGPA